MKKFLEQLNAAKITYDGLTSHSIAENDFKQMRAKYDANIGKRALYKNKSQRISRVVTIIETYESHVLVRFSCRNMGSSTDVNTAVNFSSLYCGDDVLQIEDF